VSLLSLDDPAALEAGRVGVKAALLARARQNGLPVLPGRVVPWQWASTALAHGADALAGGRVAGARRSVLAAPISAELGFALGAITDFEGPLVARSSTNLDEDHRFAGAFASLGDLQVEELPVAVRACWSSVFNPDALERLNRAAISVSDVQISVLVQRQLSPTAGGLAMCDDGGTVTVVATLGHPSELLAGAARGMRIAITSDGEIVHLGSQPQPPLPASVLVAVDRVARQATRIADGASIEWAAEEDEVFVLQVDAHGHPRRSPVTEIAGGWATPRGGRAVAGTPGSDGLAVGRVVSVESDRDVERVKPGDIVQLRAATPMFAPLLWRAGGLLVTSGSAAAHLLAVARALRVPSVVALDERISDGKMAAIDGGSGSVWILEDVDTGVL